MATSSKDRSLVRASDIGAWAYCHRAWWLAQVKGAAHRRPAVLQQGKYVHEQHGRLVLRAVWLRRVGLALVIGGIILAVLWLLYMISV